MPSEGIHGTRATVTSCAGYAAGRILPALPQVPPIAADIAMIRDGTHADLRQQQHQHPEKRNVNSPGEHSQKAKTEMCRAASSAAPTLSSSIRLVSSHPSS